MKSSYIKIILVAGLLLLIAGGVGFVAYRETTKSTSSSPDSKNPTVPATPLEVDVPTSTHVSPKGTYTVIIKHDEKAGSNLVSVVERDGKVQANIIDEEESKRLVLSRVRQNYKVGFVQWHDDTKFRLSITYTGGQKFQYDVDAKTGDGDVASFVEVK